MADVKGDDRRGQFRGELEQPVEVPHDALEQHEGQVAAIEVRIGHTKKILKQIQRSLKELRSQAAKLERSGKPITPAIKDKIAKMEQQLKDRHTSIGNRRLQKAELAAQFSEDLDRYRHLKGISKEVN